MEKRKGDYKLAISAEFPPQLFDLADDPLELRNRAGKPALSSVQQDLVEASADTWNAEALNRTIEASQRRRRFLIDTLGVGKATSWDYVPPLDGGPRYVRTGDVFPDVGRNGYLTYR